MVNINNIFCRNRIGYLGLVEFNRIFFTSIYFKIDIFQQNLNVKIYNCIIGQKPKQNILKKKIFKKSDRYFHYLYLVGY